MKGFNVIQKQLFVEISRNKKMKTLFIFATILTVTILVHINAEPLPEKGQCCLAFTGCCSTKDSENGCCRIQPGGFACCNKMENEPVVEGE
jgi:hypothetical protein